MKHVLSKAIVLGLLLFGAGLARSQAAAPATPQGVITEEVYLDIGGGVVVTDLTGNAKFTAGKPDLVNYRPYFEYQAGGDITVAAPGDVFGNSGARMAGYFYPPTTGAYVFVICADDGGNLYLSTDDNPANKKLIAMESGWSGNRNYTGVGGGSTIEAKISSTYTGTQWPTKDANGFATINLTAGRAYYIEALEKEGGGGDDLSVAVMDPNGAIDSTMPIPGAYLSSLKSSGPVTFTTQPASQTVAEGAAVSLSVDVQGTPPYTYQWTRNTVDIADGTNSTYNLARALAADNGAKFACKVTGKVGPATSADATLTVNVDTTAPTLVSAVGEQDLTHVVVTFSEPVDKTSAQTAANYTIAGLTVSAAVVQAIDSKVVLTTSAQTQGNSYTLSISNVKDASVAGNPIAANSTKTFTAFKILTGYVVIKYYDTGNPGIGGVANIVATQSPTRTVVRPDAQSASWENGSNYASLLEGVFVAPETGDYTFFIASDDQSQLFLSTDENPANLDTTPNAQVTGWTNQREWLKEAGQTGAPVTLVKNKKYFLRAYQVEGGGGDGIAIGWEVPSLAGNGAAVMPGSAFLLGVNPDNSTVSITKQPVSVTGTDGKYVSFSVAATGSSDVGTSISYQWQKNGADIPGATGTTYRPPQLTLADNGTIFKCVITVPAKQVVSDPATLTVIADNVPPVILGAGAVKNPAGTFDVGIEFDEPIDEATAAAQANYTLSAGTISKVTVFTNIVAQPGVALEVSGLTAGSKYTVTVKNVKDVKGNPITTAAKEFTVSKLSWGAVGADESALGYGAGFGVVPTAENGFDIYSDGVGEWGAFDEATFVYEQITGNFDKQLRVEYQDLSSQWARAGLIARDITNFGVDRTAQEGGAAGRYQKVHVNPVGATLTGPGNAGNQAWEGNRRLDTGGSSTSTLVGNNAIPQYPNAWCRMVRDGQVFSIYRSDNGKNWTLLGTADWVQASTGGAMPNTMFVGPEFTPENGNIVAESKGRFMAQIRDYSDTTALNSKDSVSSKKAALLGSAAFTANGGGHTAATGDYAVDLGRGGGAPMVQVTDPTFLNVPAAADELSFSLWIKRYDINDSSAFWARSREGGTTDRGFQAHTPWSDNNVVFDTVGCCDTANQRIVASATTASGYTGLDWWTNSWHHWVFTKKADQKNIYIDGKLFLNGSSLNALPTDFAELVLGAEARGANSMHGLIDDFAVFGKALTLAQANSLFTGSAPSSISGAQLLAFWNFNDAPISAETPEISSVARSTGGITIIYKGTLQSADVVTGPYTDVAGATSPYSTAASAAQKYFRTR